MNNRSWKKLTFLAMAVGMFFPLAYPLISQTVLAQQKMDIFRQALREVRQNSTVMIVALRPGEEDLQLTSYFRFNFCAKVVHAFITNGEAGSPDLGTLYPNELAAQRRLEADNAARAFDAEAWFLNFPDFSATPGEDLLRATWQPDTFQVKMARLISLTRPSIVIICQDPMTDSSNRLTKYVEEIMLITIQNMSNPTMRNAVGLAKFAHQWNVEKVYVPSLKWRGWVPPEVKDTNRSKHYQSESSRKADLCYRIQAEQRKQWFDTPSLGYSVSWPRKYQGSKNLAIETHSSISKRMQGLKSRVEYLCDSLELAVKNTITVGQKLFYDRKLLTLLKAIDFRYTETGQNLPSDRRLLDGWREGLLYIRQLLYGIEVYIRQSESIVTNIQIVFMTVDSVKGLPTQGTTDLYITDTQKGWFLNETLTDHISIHPGDTFRLLSPGKNLHYNYPMYSKGLKADRVWEELPYTIIHTGASIEESFIIRQRFRFLFSEKMDIEPLRPLIRLQVGEILPIMLTNHSRDGVHGKVFLGDSLVKSTEVPFRLLSKEDRRIDTVMITHISPMTDTTILIPVMIDGFIVNAVAGRAFQCKVDSSATIAVLTVTPHSIITDAVHRIGVRQVTEISNISELSKSTTPHVLIVDYHALNLITPTLSREIFHFAEKGGHVLVLSQNLSVLRQWQQFIDFPLSQHFNTLLDSVSFILSTGDSLLQTPNRLTEAEFQGFVFHYIHHLIQQSSKSWDIPLIVQNRDQQFPGILTRMYGCGRITYCNLALPQQWLNIHPGSLRLLANLISWKNQQ